MNYIYVYLYDSVPFGSILVGWEILDTRSRSERAPEHFSCSHLGCRFHCVFMCVLMCVCKVLYICQHQSVGQTLKRSHKYLVSPSSLPTDPCFLTWVLYLLIFLRGGLVIYWQLSSYSLKCLHFYRKYFHKTENIIVGVDLESIQSDDKKNYKIFKQNCFWKPTICVN